MKLFYALVGMAAVAAASVAAARAQNYPWCAAFHDGAGVNCGFSTYEQCMATSRGSGGSCVKNNTYKGPAARSPARRVKHKSAARRHN